MDWLDKLKEFKAESHKTYKEISDETGIPLTTLEKLFSGRTRDPKLLMMRDILNTLGHTVGELAGEDISITKEERELLDKVERLDFGGKKRVFDTLSAEIARIEAQKRSVRQFTKIFYDFPVSAGTGEYLDERCARIVELNEAPPSGTDYILRVSGDSMEPEFANGDHIYVARDNSIAYGEIGIFTVAGSVYMKQYTHAGLHSLNPSYATIPPSPDIRCIGRVLDKVSGTVSFAD